MGDFLESVFDRNGILELKQLKYCRHYFGAGASGLGAGSTGVWLRTDVDAECLTAGQPEWDVKLKEGKAMYCSMYALCRAAKAWIEARYPEPFVKTQPEITDFFNQLSDPDPDPEPVSDAPNDNDNEISTPSLPSNNNSDQPQPASSDLPDSDQIEFSSFTTAIPRKVAEGSPRIKMRVHVLACLLNEFHKGRQELEVAVSLLCNDPTISVLHRCGCGLSKEGLAGDLRRAACVRPGHLMLGGARLNRLQAHWHEGLETCALSGEEVYQGFRRAVSARYGEEYPGGSDVF